MKKILMHVCCAPCFIAPYEFLTETEGLEVYGFWYNHNIHPYQEYDKRYMTLKAFAEERDIKMIWKDSYELKSFLRESAFREENRCYSCYYKRIEHAAKIAKKGKFDYFSTTLLYSKFQKHELIRSICESIAKKESVKFYYHDFREFWKKGIEESKKTGMYRQQYCGCIYSEQERYESQLKKNH